MTKGTNRIRVISAELVQILGPGSYMGGATTGGSDSENHLTERSYYVIHLLKLAFFKPPMFGYCE